MIVKHLIQLPSYKTLHIREDLILICQDKNAAIVLTVLLNNYDDYNTIEFDVNEVTKHSLILNSTMVYAGIQKLKSLSFISEGDKIIKVHVDFINTTLIEAFETDKKFQRVVIEQISNKRKTKKFSEEDWQYKLAVMFYKQMASLNALSDSMSRLTAYQWSIHYQNGAKTFDQLSRLDGYSKERITQILNYLFQKESWRLKRLHTVPGLRVGSKGNTLFDKISKNVNKSGQEVKVFVKKPEAGLEYTEKEMDAIKQAYNIEGRFLRKAKDKYVYIQS